LYEFGGRLSFWLHIFFRLFSEGKFLVTKFEFGGSFGMSLEEVCHELYTQFRNKLMPYLEVTKKLLEKKLSPN
jgi:hypothetical protein